MSAPMSREQIDACAPGLRYANDTVIRNLIAAARYGLDMEAEVERLRAELTNEDYEYVKRERDAARAEVERLTQGAPSFAAFSSSWSARVGAAERERDAARAAFTNLRDAVLRVPAASLSGKLDRVADAYNKGAADQQDAVRAVVEGVGT